MFTPSIKLGKVNGVDFKISLGWVFILLGLTAALRKPESYNRYLELINLLTLGQISLKPAFPQSQIAMLAFTVTVLVGVYLSVILHEIGHATAARNRGINVKSISLWIAGGIAKIESIPPAKEFPITIAGPAVTAVLVPIYALISAVLFSLNLTTIAWVFLLLTLFNFGMFVFNLLPLFPLDGGRILRSLLTNKTNYLKATKYSFYATVTFIATAIAIMITFSYYDYLFISSLVALLSYVNYQRFKQTYNPENITEPNEFYIYEQTFAFDPQDITDKQERTLADYIKSQGGQTTVNKEEADFIVSRKPPALQRENETVYVLPLVLIQKVEENGTTVSHKFKNQFKL